MDIDLTNVAAVLVVLTPLTLLLVGIFVLPDGASLDHLFRPPSELEWPRGVQEEEPVAWHIERLTQPQRGAATNEPAVARREPRAVADLRSKRAA